MRVLIADDHAVFRRGLKETIGEAFPKVTFGEAKTALDGLLAEWTRGQDKYALMDRLQAAGVPAGAVQPPADRVERDPQPAAPTGLEFAR